ncbi:MAG: HutD family protein [bacterium]
MRVLHEVSYRRLPWKNGLGSTLEIATDAAEAGAPWTWRLSFADVPERATFSNFPGIDRHIGVLDGAGLTLARGDERITVPRDGTAFAFAGEDAIVGEPLGPAVRDANLMLDRRLWSGTLEILRIGSQREISINSDVALIHVHGAAQSAEFRTEGESSPLGANSTLVCGGTVLMTAAEATLVVARIARREVRDEADRLRARCRP